MKFFFTFECNISISCLHIVRTYLWQQQSIEPNLEGAHEALVEGRSHCKKTHLINQKKL
jgi:hypothetical protein